MPPTAAQISRLRTRPHRTVLNLGVYEPTTAFAARLNHPSVPKNSRVLTVSLLAGNPAEVVRGMTVYIGTYPNGRDVARLRAISATATTLTVAENSLTWMDGWYLTIVRFYEPWAVYPRIILDPNNVPIFYRDYDIVYADQNQYMDPVVNMGPNHAGYLQTGAHSVYYSSSGTYDPTPGGLATGFAWVFEGGMPTASVQRDPGYIAYTGCGQFTTSLTVTTSFGKSLTGRRHVMIYERASAGACRPIVRWGLESFEGSRDQGGYALRLWVRELADQVKITDGALIVIFTEDWEGGVQGKAAAGSEHREHTLFCGYVEDDSIMLDPETNKSEFRVRSVTGRMERLATFSAPLESKVNAMTWNELVDMTVDRAAVNYLRWYSTILTIADFSPTGDIKPVQFFDSGRGNLYEGLDSFLQGTLGAKAVADRQGKIWSEIDGNLLATGTARNVLIEVLSGTRQDWRSQISIERRPDSNLAYLEAGGIAYSGPATGTIGAFLAGAPGEAPNYFGGVERFQGLVIEGQTQLNAYVGLLLADRDALYPEVGMPMAGDYRIIDIAPQVRVGLTLLPAENYRAVSWSDKKFLPQAIGYQFDPSDSILSMEVRLKEETFGPPGDTVIIPIDPPYSENDLPEWDFQFPPLLPFPGIFPPIFPEPPSGDVAYYLLGGGVSTAHRLARTRNFQSASPTWELVVGFPTGIALPGGTSDLFFSPSNYSNIAFFVRGAGSANLGYFTNDLAAPVTHWTQYWGPAQDAALGGVPNMQTAGIPPSLGYHCMIFGGAAGGTQFVYGSPFSFAQTTIGPIGGGNLGRNTPVMHIGGSTVVAGLDRWLTRSDALGAASWNTFSKTPNRTADTVYDGQGILFNHLNDGSLMFDPLSWAFPILASRFIDVTPVVAGIRYLDPHGGSGQDKFIVQVGDTTYATLVGESGGLSFFFKKGPGLSPWLVVGSTAPSALDVFGPNPAIMAGRLGVSASTQVVGSSDGGATWTNKTGNLAVLAGGASALNGGTVRLAIG